MEDSSSVSWLTTIKAESNETPRQGHFSYQSYSYQKVVEQASLIAESLMSLQIQPNARVLIILSPDVNLYTHHLACILNSYTPIIYQPPNFKQSAADYDHMLEHILESSQAEYIITSKQELQKTDFSLVVKTTLILIETLNLSHSFSYNKFQEQISHHSPINTILQYSSGTTGAKKGTAFGGDEIVKHIDILSDTLCIQSNDKVISWLPLYHDMGFVACWLLPLLTKTPLYTMSAHEWIKNPILFFEATTYFSPTLCWLPNFSFSLFTKRTPPNARIRLHSLRSIISCSEFISYKTCEDFAKKFTSLGLKANVISSSYAMAENIFAVTQMPMAQANQILIVDQEQLNQGQIQRAYYSKNTTVTLMSSGKATTDVDIQIFNEQDQSLPQGTIGKIAFKSSTLFKQYIVAEGQEHLIQQDQRSHGYYITKDYGFLYDDYLYVLGRTDDVMIIGGKNIYPYDLEDIINETDDVIPGRAVAFSHSNSEHVDEIILLVEISPQRSKPLNQITIAIRSSINKTLDIPVGEIVLLPHKTLSKSTSGKLSRGTNKKRYLNQEFQELNLLKQQVSTTQQIHQAMSSTEKCLLTIVADIMYLDISALRTDLSLFKTGMLDSFNTHVFFDGLIKVFPHLEINKFKQKSQDLDTIEQIARYLDEQSTLPSNPSSSPIDSHLSNRSHKPNRAQPTLASVAEVLFSPINLSQQFKLHEAKESPTGWFKDASKLKLYPHKRALRYGGWIESPKAQSELISTDSQGFRNTYKNQRIVSEDQWLQSKLKGAIFGNSVSFGVGVSDQQTYSSLLNDVTPVTWKNLSTRGAPLASIIELLPLVRKYQVNRVIILGNSDFKQLGDRLRALGVKTKSQAQLHLNKFYRNLSLQIKKLSNYNTSHHLSFVLSPSYLHGQKAYNQQEAESFWQACGLIEASLHEAYYSYYPLLDELSDDYLQFMETELTEHDIHYLNYAQDPIFNSAEELYLDCSHFTELMHALISIKLSEEMR